MANEIQVASSPDLTVYVDIRDTDGLVWKTTTSAFVTFADADIANYAISLTEQGTSSGYYVGNFPTAITTPGSYAGVAYRQIGGSPAVGDEVIGTGNIVWTGTAVDNGATGANLISTYVAKIYAGVTGTAQNSLFDNVLVPAASAAVVNYLGWNPNATDYNELHDGQGDWLLQLRNYPVLTLTKVTVEPYGVTTEIIAGTEFIIDRNNGAIQLKPTSTSWAFFWKGFQNIQVEYRAGYTPVPSDIQTATGMVCQMIYKSLGTDPRLKSEKDVSYSYQIRDQIRGSMVLTPEVKDLLDPYRRRLVVF